jgi:hypothetical protein
MKESQSVSRWRRKKSNPRRLYPKLHHNFKWNPHLRNPRASSFSALNAEGYSSLP